jgi:hypothetical protein
MRRTSTPEVSQSSLQCSPVFPIHTKHTRNIRNRKLACHQKFKNEAIRRDNPTLLLPNTMANHNQMIIMKWKRKCARVRISSSLALAAGKNLSFVPPNSPNAAPAVPDGGPMAYKEEWKEPVGSDPL